MVQGPCGTCPTVKSLPVVTHEHTIIREVTLNKVSLVDVKKRSVLLVLQN